MRLHAGTRSEGATRLRPAWRAGQLPIAMLVAVLAAGCATEPAPSTASAASVVAPSAVAGGTDLAWTQLTLALDERALQVLDLAPQRAADPHLRTLAAEVATGHRDEIAKLRQLLRQTGAPSANPHEGHVMPGMVSPENLTLMAKSTGKAFDVLLASSLREHLNQCLHLAKSEQQAGSEPTVKAFAAAIETARRRDLDRLAALPT